MNGNRPVYRRPPRSHAYSCRCPRCGTPARGSGGAAWILPAFFGACAVVMGIVWAARGLYHAVAADLGLLALLLIPAAVIAVLKVAGTRQAPRPVTAADLPLPPPSVIAAVPACLHPAAVPVETPLGERVAWLCPDCDAQLDPGARSTELSPDASWPAVRRVVR